MEYARNRAALEDEARRVQEALEEETNEYRRRYEAAKAAFADVRESVERDKEFVLKERQAVEALKAELKEYRSKSTQEMQDRAEKAEEAEDKLQRDRQELREQMEAWTKRKQLESIQLEEEQLERRRLLVKEEEKWAEYIASVQRKDHDMKIREDDVLKQKQDVVKMREELDAAYKVRKTCRVPELIL
eukprot:scaffold80_cov382-Prasinococcus_capsulatus_cf.AAC.12